MGLASGDQLEHYKIQSLIGKGGMGEVYRATDTQLKRDVALKVLLPAFARDPERYARFRREAEVLASLNHPNIATLYGLADDARIMELVEGVTLPCPLPLDTAIKYARQIARPKSTSFADPSPFTRMLPGFKSRCRRLSRRRIAKVSLANRSASSNCRGCLWRRRAAPKAIESRARI